MFKRILTTLFAIQLVIGAHASYAMTTIAKQAIIIDYGTGQVLFSKNPDEKMPTSSMSKTMTAYAVFDALKKGKVSLDGEFLVSKKAWKKGGSKMFVEVDKMVKVEDLLRGVLIQSGNDATIVLAEGLAGNEDYFAEAITAMAHSLGMKNSNFKNASGWPDPDHYSTARDLSTLATHLIRDFPEYYHIFSEKEFTFSNITQRNRNPLLYRNIGADGLKTGHTEIGGYGLMASGVNKDGRRVILVLNGLPSEKARAQEGARLLEWGLKRFEYHTFFKAGETVKSPAVIYGKSKTVDAIPHEDIIAAVPALAMGMRNVKAEASFDEPLTAPIHKGDKVGLLTVTIPEQEALTFPLYAKEDVPQKNIILRALEKLPALIKAQREK